MVKAAATRLERFAKLANQLTRHCDASDTTLANLASDITPLLATLDVAYSNLTKQTESSKFKRELATPLDFNRDNGDGDVRID
jgi:ABC-type transporter Mla subunit MlaD